jgi:hypothetical protein
LRFNLTVLHVKISFLLLLLGVFVAILFGTTYDLDYGMYRFALYDLAIHSIAIGFIGITISLYLPLMLPPIIGKTVQFTNLNKIPLLLIVLALGLRAMGDVILAQSTSIPNFVSQFSLVYAKNIEPFVGPFGLACCNCDGHVRHNVA